MDLARIAHLRPPPPPQPSPRREPGAVSAAEWLSRAPVRPAAIVVGIPFAGGSISRARTDLAPTEVRRELARLSVWGSDEEVSFEHLPVLDAGDLECDADVEKTQACIEEAVSALRAQAGVPLAALGGDNSITVGLARGVRAGGLLTFDAHHDCRDPGLGATNGSPVRQLVEDGIRRIVQVGIHGFANARPHARWAHDHGVKWFVAGSVRDLGIDLVVQRGLALLDDVPSIWVDVDLDVLDRAFAPGAPAAMPGGLWPSDLERAAYLLGRNERVLGMDIVELDPTADVASTTVRTACTVLLAFLAGVASR